MSQKRLKRSRKQIEAGTEIKAFGENKMLSFWVIIKENWMFLAAMCVLAIAIYWNGINGDFVSDDYATIPQNPDVASFSRTLATTPNLVSLSNTLVASVFGVSSPFPFHLLSLIIFLATIVTGYVFVYLMVGKNLAMLTIALFTVHPIHVEAVTWISGKPYSLFSPFAFGLLISFILYLRSSKRVYLWVMFILFLIEYKVEPVRLLGLILFVIPLVAIFSGSVKNLRNIWPKILMVVVILGVVVTMLLWSRIVARVNIVNSGYNVSESVFYNPLFQYPVSVSKYLQLLLVPTDLTLYHTMFVFPSWLNWLIFISYLACVTYFLFKDKRISFALIFIFAGAAASMAPVKVAWLVAERYIFFGSIGFCLFLAIIVSEIGRKSIYVATALLTLIMIVFSVRTFYRNDNWNTNHKLWVNTCQVSPNSHNAWNNIGDDYDKLAEYENAIKGFTQSTVVKPNYADAFHNRANIFFKTGRLDLARDSYNTALYFSPNLFQTYLSLTQIDLMEGNLTLALQHASKAVELEPSNPQPAYVLAIVYAQAGEADKARQILTRIVQLNPGYKIAADALRQLNDLEMK